MCVMELASILRQHLQRLSETRPSFAIDCVSVAHGMNVWTCFVNGSMYQKAGSIGGSGPIATNDFAIKIHQDHVASFEETEMNTQRIGPECIGMLRTTDRDVTRNPFDVAFARPVPKCSSHMLELPLPLCGKVIKCWYA